MTDRGGRRRRDGRTKATTGNDGTDGQWTDNDDDGTDGRTEEDDSGNGTRRDTTGYEGTDGQRTTVESKKVGS